MDRAEGNMAMNAEKKRLEEDKEQKEHWRRWGPYVSERQWGTVREDYSAHGDAWNFFPHDHARSRAYRWGEDGIAGISDNHQRLCFALAFWNEEDPILKERYFGLTNAEGNHGEDVKEYYFYLDNTPTHSYMKCLYKYPHRRFPYELLIGENRKRGLEDREFELVDTGIFSEDRYFDIFVEYAKASADDILIQIRVINRGPEPRTLRILPTLWFRNTWSWNHRAARPLLEAVDGRLGMHIVATHAGLGKRYLYAEGPSEALFTENETNSERLFGTPNATPFVKDAFHNYIIHGAHGAVNPKRKGTKAAYHYQSLLAPKGEETVRLRLTDVALTNPFSDFDVLFNRRIREADEFYRELVPETLDEEHKRVQRQAFAGMLWTKQYYHYVLVDWLRGDQVLPPPAERKRGRNANWDHFYSEDILSMPDKWEYPWFASWDLAFHCIPLSLVDPEFAKKQLMLLVREWYMHPNGQIPAYEWSFEDVNPPVHAWAAWRVYKIDKKHTGTGDKTFLERVFQKLLLNFTWWVNRKDVSGKNIFEGGFLGLDNISVFNRSEAIVSGGYIDQSDATSWMGMYCLNMLTMALELAKENPAYEDIASKFFEHFLYIAEAISHMGERSIPLWNAEDGFFYDIAHLPDGSYFPLKVRSMVGLIPLFAVETIEHEMVGRFPGFKKRYEWFIRNRSDLCGKVASMVTSGVGERIILSLVKPDQLRQILDKMLDQEEFLSPYGIRALSRYHKNHPYVLSLSGEERSVHYNSGDSTSRLFGGNSNWRGPVWFPVNFLLIESLQKFHHYFGDKLSVECPTGSGNALNLWDVSLELSRRLIRIFLRDEKGKRPVFGDSALFNHHPDWRNYIPFHEYFHGDDGSGVGASHQTGWTGLVAKLIQQSGEYDARRPPRTSGGLGAAVAGSEKLPEKQTAGRQEPQRKGAK